MWFRRSVFQVSRGAIVRGAGKLGDAEDERFEAVKGVEVDAPVERRQLRAQEARALVLEGAQRR
jgi:hypothetical protein